MTDFDNLTYLHGKPQGQGILKANPEDFVVVEDLGFAPDGEGEHLLVRILKTDCNTRFVADALAKFLKIHAREVSFAGQKDKHAVTEQWLCARLPGKEMPDLSKFQLEGCQVLEYARHKRKLRLGALKGNQFTLILREISDRQEVETRLQAIAERGVPNYFGAQRFGIGGSNLQGALRWAESGAPVRDRNKRSFWLSAARSALFNQQVGIRLKKPEFNQVVDGDALQLAGRGSWFVATPEERAQLQDTVQAPRNKAAAHADIAVGHQLNKADQHPGEKDLRHPPGFKVKQNARQKRLKPSGHPDPIDQQQNGDQTKGRYQLHKE